MGLTIKDLEKLQKLGKIRGFQVRELKPVKVEVGGRIVTKHWGKVSKEKDWLGSNLLMWANDKALTLEEEYRFHVERKWRFDWCIPAIKTAIEYNGIFSHKSRHTTPAGYSADLEKINAAQVAGWIVVQVTPMNYKSVIDQLNQIYETHLCGRD
jgi:hypothetical protein